MPLSLSELEDIRDEYLADDIDIDYERCLPCRCFTPSKEHGRVLSKKEWDAVAKASPPKPGCAVRPLPGTAFDKDLRGYAATAAATAAAAPFKGEQDWENVMSGNNPAEERVTRPEMMFIT